MPTPHTDSWLKGRQDPFERHQDLLVPRKGELLDILVDMLPFPPGEAMQAVDVGAGQGALAERLLVRFPKGELTLVDVSEDALQAAMLKLQRFSGRFRCVLGDVNTPDWCALVAGPVDLVASCDALHCLRAERRRPFLGEVIGLLRPGGCFADGDAFDLHNAFMQERLTLRLLEHAQERLWREEKVHVPIEELRERYLLEAAPGGGERRRLDDYLGDLTAAGAATADVVWRFLLQCVVLAVSPGPAARSAADGPDEPVGAK